jgi:hypothetical protein
LAGGKARGREGARARGREGASIGKLAAPKLLNNESTTQNDVTNCATAENGLVEMCA